MEDKDIDTMIQVCTRYHQACVEAGTHGPSYDPVKEDDCFYVSITLLIDDGFNKEALTLLDAAEDQCQTVQQEYAVNTNSNDFISL